jgi:hypothetical protein
MENINNEMPRELPNRKHYIIPIKSNSIPIIQKYNDDSTTRDQFDPSSFPSSPSNEFLKFLKQRIKQY